MTSRPGRIAACFSYRDKALAGPALLNDGTLEVELSFHGGDEATLRAERESSSTPC